ncbi:MAG: PAS domain S-box protein [Oscillatoriales cyanobacterium]|uniref:histidine kinase n=1 Tax=Microcoleus anatoxicus PTRS2 TaxID=2705321 RepID=A0ABU8YI46_9CYAN|nr:MAG: PAS domain S-box protein [Oscillatoriales cyanobacterium]TAD94818.1 MAG: PAS domain S-box protein [Oscillatoriales cyanobacterium]TAE05840.1 MAG: PAS domain S-box protein [Oscillatoriales cyanobacterium]TAF03387.1 MAG: PAS domain S-box protein [Oscillatoriales cyanobacterium]TAF42561.1 MAG: PAS domain S-box protein [Oscillatoriales cyanobacterium]
MQEEPSKEQLFLEVQSLRAELENLKREKADLEILLETTTEHSDTIEADLLSKAELAVRSSEEQFRAIASATPVPVLVSRLCDGLILYANAQMASLLDTPSAELIGRHTPDFYFDPAERSKVLEILATNGHIQNYELHCKKADGSSFWAIISVQSLLFNGQPTALCALYDLTQRKEAEQALQESEQRLRRQSLALLQLGRQRTINNGALNLGVREITEAAARTLDVEKVSVWLYNHVKFGTRYATNTQANLAARAIAHNQSWVINREAIEIPVEHLVNHSKLPTQNLKLVCLDLYDRTSKSHLNRTKNHIKVSNLDGEGDVGSENSPSSHPLDSALTTQNPVTTLSLETEHTPILSQESTPNSSILNVAIRLGGQIVGILSLEHIGAPRQWALEERTFADSLANLVALAIEGFERQRAQEALSKAKSELEITVEQRTAQLTASNKLLRIEIAERKRAEIALQEALHKAEAASRAKSTFLANMSHELRTPLNAIIGYSEILEEEALEAGFEDLIPDTQKIQTAGKHLLTLINDILDLSKIEAGRMDLYLEDFHLGNLVEEVVATLYPLVEKNRNQLQFFSSPDLGVMYGDLTKVRQILLNLLSNALKFTQEGTVVISATRELTDGTEWIYLRVADTGIGMSPQQQEGLFEPFIQGDTSTTRKYGGTGLGLAISRLFCQMMGGDITIESELGVGSTFTVQLKAKVEASC